jgi:transposase
MITKRRLHPEVFKRESVARVASSGLSVGAVANELGLHESVLRRWVRESGIAGAGVVRRSSTVSSLPSPSDLASENARLRRENDRLLRARDNPAGQSLLLAFDPDDQPVLDAICKDYEGKNPTR